tara:strand:+ start:254 stop:619 length:366 start_codon:yes stop_codon:yes gene_type:complete
MGLFLLHSLNCAVTISNTNSSKETLIACNGMTKKALNKSKYCTFRIPTNHSYHHRHPVQEATLAYWTKCYLEQLWDFQLRNENYLDKEDHDEIDRKLHACNELMKVLRVSLSSNEVYGPAL